MHGSVWAICTENSRLRGGSFYALWKEWFSPLTQMAHPHFSAWKTNWWMWRVNKTQQRDILKADYDVQFEKPLRVSSLKYAQKTQYVWLRAWISSAHAKSGINARSVSTHLQDQGLMGNALLHENNKMDMIIMSFYLPRAWNSKNQWKGNPQ